MSPIILTSLYLSSTIWIYIYDAGCCSGCGPERLHDGPSGLFKLKRQRILSDVHPPINIDITSTDAVNTTLQTFIFLSKKNQSTTQLPHNKKPTLAPEKPDKLRHYNREHASSNASLLILAKQRIWSA